MLTTIRNISFTLLAIGITAILGVVSVATPELSPGDTSGQLLWLARGCLVFCVCGLLSMIIGTRSSCLNFSTFSALVSWILICMGGINAIWGLKQIYGFAYSNHYLFSLTGSFFNPGPYSGYLAMILPIALYEWLRLSENKQRSLLEYIGYYLSFSVTLLIICILPAGMSRSAWIAAIVSCGLVLAIHYSWKQKLKEQWNKNRRKMLVVIILSVLIIIVSASVLFLIKKDSASGRLFMWKISTMAVLEKPLGYGTGSFPAVYGETQQAYFANGCYSEREELVAGSPEYAFNEYLHIALEWGIPTLIGLLLLVGVCICVAIRKRRIGIAAAIVSLLIFAFSSYPFQLPVFISTFFFLLVASFMDNRKVALGILAVVVGISGLYLLRTSVYEESVKWGKSRMLYQAGAYESAIKEYTALYPALKKRAAFLFEYGHAYHKIGEYERSNEILMAAIERSNDPMIMNIIGKNYQSLQEYGKAEQFFIRSTNRLPGRIYPYYLLAKLYAEPDFYNKEKFERMVEIVLTKEPKVNSTAIREMREEIQKINAILDKDFVENR